MFDERLSEEEIRKIMKQGFDYYIKCRKCGKIELRIINYDILLTKHKTGSMTVKFNIGGLTDAYCYECLEKDYQKSKGE